MSWIQSKITQVKNQENFNSYGERQSPNANIDVPQMLELSDNNDEAAIIKMLQVRVNILETESLSKERENIKK